MCQMCRSQTGDDPTPRCLNVRIAFAVIGTLVGLSIFLSFLFMFDNLDCAIWGLMSGIFAGITTGVHLKFRQDRWEFPAGQACLTSLMTLGCITQLAGLCAFCAYIAVAITEQQALVPEGFYVVAVWCAMTFKWGFLLFFYSRSYRGLATGYKSLGGSDNEKAIVGKEAYVA